MTNAPDGTRRLGGTIRCRVNLTAAVRVQQYQVNQTVIVVVAVSMMQFDVRIELNHLPTAGARPPLVIQDLGTKTRRRTQRLLPITLGKVVVPFWVERVDGTSDLEMPLRLDRLLYPNYLFSCIRVGKRPGCPVQEVGPGSSSAVS